MVKFRDLEVLKQSAELEVLKFNGFFLRKGLQNIIKRKEKKGLSLPWFYSADGEILKCYGADEC